MPRRVIHIAQGVKPEQLKTAIEFYTELFPDIVPYVGDVTLGTGKTVNGAHWKGDYIYFFLFEGCEVSASCGIDHLGIMFENDDDKGWCQERMRAGRWLKDPTGMLVWELFRSGERPMTYDDSRCKDLFAKLSPEDRLKLFDGYCKECGEPHPPGRICQCWNDE